MTYLVLQTMEKGFRALNDVLTSAWRSDFIHKDLKFCCRGGTVQAHKFVVTIPLTLLNDLISGNQDPITTIYLPDVLISDMMEALKSMYTDCDTSQFIKLLEPFEMMPLSLNEFNDDNFCEIDDDFSQFDPPPLVDEIEMTFDESKLMDESNLIDDSKLIADPLVVVKKLSYVDLIDEHSVKKAKVPIRNGKRRQTRGKEQDKETRCEICNITFPSFMKFHSHRIKNHGKIFFKCIYCDDDTEYKGRRQIYEHTAKCNPPVIDYLKTPPQRFKCGFCDKTDLIQVDLEAHIESQHAGDECSICREKVFEISFLHHAVTKHSEGSYRCPFPGCESQPVKSVHSLRAHTFMKHLGHYEKCPYCDIIITGKFIRHHINTTHKEKDTTSASCEICGKVFGNKGSLNAHKNIYHKPEPRHCRECKQDFPNGQEYFYHRNIKHRNRVKEQKVPCTYCGLAMLKSKLKLHVIHEHLNTDVEINCYVCNMNTSNVDALRKHFKRMHKNIECKSIQELIEYYNLKE